MPIPFGGSDDNNAHLSGSFTNPITQISIAAEEECQGSESHGSVSPSKPPHSATLSYADDTISNAATKHGNPPHREHLPPGHYCASCLCKDMEEEQQYFQQILGSSSAGWTDEKHSSYVDLMEADFLRNVMFEGNVLIQPSSAHVTHPASNKSESSDLEDCASSPYMKPPEQFKTWRYGRWRPVSVQARSHTQSRGPMKQLVVAVKNPWIKRLRRPQQNFIPSLMMKVALIDGKPY